MSVFFDKNAVAGALLSVGLIAGVTLGVVTLQGRLVAKDTGEQSAAIERGPIKEVGETYSHPVPHILKSKLDKITIVRDFEPGVSGMTGWVVQIRGEGEHTQSVVYTSNDGQYLFAGNIIDAADKNLTAEHMEIYTAARAAPQPQAQPQPQPGEPGYRIDYDTVKGILDNQPVVSVGSGEKRVVVLIDPNCPYCHQYFDAIMADLEAYQGVTFDFMPVGLLGMDSVQKAALFSGKGDAEKLALLKSMMAGANVADVPAQEDAQASMNRTQTWTNAGLSVVPMTIIGMGTDNETAIPGVVSKDRLKFLL